MHAAVNRSVDACPRNKNVSGDCSWDKPSHAGPFSSRLQKTEEKLNSTSNPSAVGFSDPEHLLYSRTLRRALKFLLLLYQSHASQHMADRRVRVIGPKHPVVVEGNEAAKLGVLGFVDYPHAVATKLSEDAVMGDGLIRQLKSFAFLWQEE